MCFILVLLFPQKGEEERVGRGKKKEKKMLATSPPGYLNDTGIRTQMACSMGKAERGILTSTKSTPGYHQQLSRFCPKHKNSKWPIGSGGRKREESCLGIARWAKKQQIDDFNDYPEYPAAYPSSISAKLEAAKKRRKNNLISLSGTVVSTFGNSSRFKTNRCSTPGPNEYDTRWNHPRIIKHLFRSPTSQQLLSSGTRTRGSLVGSVDSKRNVFITNNDAGNESRGPSAYNPSYPTMRTPTFNHQFRLQQLRSDHVVTPRPPGTGTGTGGGGTFASPHPPMRDRPQTARLVRPKNAFL